jgi:hypothetical protein
MAAARRQPAKAQPANRNPRQRQQKTLSPSEIKLLVADVLKEAGLDDVATIAEKAAKDAVAQTLLSLGVDTRDPMSAQSTFHTLKGLVHTFAEKEFQADLAHLRTWRLATESIKTNTTRAVVGVAITGLAGLLWLGLGLKIKMGG